jgi:hypothetical protein
MSTSFAEALATLAARQPRVVREHEVLRVSATLTGEDAQAAALAAAAEVLKWATRQAGTKLPDQAWAGESFELPLPGRDPTAIRLRTAAADLWAFRLHRPDRNVPGRAWTTEVVLGHVPGQAARFSTRLLVATDEPELAIAPAVPGFLRQVAQKCGLAAGSQRLCTEPEHFRSREDGEALIDHLTDPGRVLPTIVLTCFEGDGAPPLDAAVLNGQLIGLAHVAVAHPDACWTLTERLGKRLSVFGGAARIYLPRFDEASDPYAHRLVLAGALAVHDGVEKTSLWLRQTAAGASLHRSRLGRDVLAFADLRAASLEARQAELREAGNESEQLAAALAQVQALQAQFASILAENNYYLDEYERERERAEAAEAQSQAAAWRIQQLSAKLREAGVDSDASLELPEAWDGFTEWCEQQFAGRLVLAPGARRGVRKPVFTEPRTAARALHWLATAARDRFTGGGGTLANIPIFEGIQNAPCGEDSFDFDWAGRRFTADWHVKNGGNTRDPSRCLRIYYCFDQQTQQIIVAEMPAHRRTGAT